MEHKVCDSEIKAADEGELTVVHFISSENPDRGHEILYADGMRMFGRPVVMFQHGRGEQGLEPVAKNVWLRKGQFRNRNGIEAKTQFFPDDLGKRLWQKNTEGYMPNWSVGWRPLREEYKTDRSGVQIRHVYEWELLEYSIVAVPMQPDAQTLAFKVMPPEQENASSRSLLHDILKSGEKITVNVPDELIDRTVKRVLKKELDRVRGKVF